MTISRRRFFEFLGALSTSVVAGLPVLAAKPTRSPFWSLLINVDGNITGLKIYNDGETSSLTFVADNFQIQNGGASINVSGPSAT